MCRQSSMPDATQTHPCCYTEQVDRQSLTVNILVSPRIADLRDAVPYSCCLF